MSALSSFWGAASLLLPFFIRFNSLNDVRISKSYALVAMAFVSAMCFGVELATEWTVIALGAILYVNVVTKDFYTGAALEQLVATMAGIFILYQLISLKKYLRPQAIYFWFRVCAVLCCVIVFLHAYGFNPYNPDVIMPYPVGPLGQQTLTGALLAALLPSFFETRKTILFVPVVVAALYLLGSTMSWVAAGSAVWLYLMIRFRHYWPLVIVLSLAVVMVISKTADPEFLSPHGRLIAWNESLNLWLDGSFLRRAFGNGLGWYWNHSQATFMGEPFRHAHSELLQALPEFGLFGVFCLIGLASIPFFLKIDAIAHAGLFALYINSLANFTFHLAPLALVAIIYYALALTGGKNDYDCYQKL